MTAATTNSTIPTAGRAWMMTLMVGLYASNFVDRTIVHVLQQPIKQELALEDWQLGMLSGTAFAFFYSALSIWIARLAERKDRTKIAATCILIWSGMTILCGLATSFLHLLLLRIGVAAGEAGATPTGQSLISDHYSPEERPLALAIFQSGNTLGHVLGALLGGVVGQAVGWRWAFVVAGAPGIILAVLVLFTIRDPRNALPQRPAVAPLKQVLSALLRNRTWVVLVCATTLLLFASYSISAFITPHLMRSFQLPLRAAGLIGGMGGGVMLGLGTLGGGVLAQALARRDRRWVMLVPGTALLLAAPLAWLAFSAVPMAVAVPAFFLMNLCVGSFQGPVFATNHSLVTADMRATATAVVMLVVTLVGLGLGPLFVGLLSDSIAARTYSGDFAAACTGAAVAKGACAAASAIGLRLALMTSGLVFAAAGALYLLASRTVTRDILD